MFQIFFTIEEECYKRYTLFYGQNFKAISASNFCISEAITIGKKSNDLYGLYFDANSNSNRSGYYYSIVDLNIPENGSYILEFDTTIGNSNQEANSTIFYILSKSYLKYFNYESYLSIMSLDNNIIFEKQEIKFIYKFWYN